MKLLKNIPNILYTLLAIYLLSLPLLIKIGVEFIAIFFLFFFASLALFIYKLYEFRKTKKLNTFQKLILTGLTLLFLGIILSNIYYGTLDRFVKYSTYYIGALGFYFISLRYGIPKYLKIVFFLFIIINLGFSFYTMFFKAYIKVLPLIHTDLLGQRPVRYFGYREVLFSKFVCRPNGLYFYPTTFTIGMFLLSLIVFTNKKRLGMFLAFVGSLLSITRTTILITTSLLFYDLFKKKKVFLISSVVVVLLLTSVMVLPVDKIGIKNPLARTKSSNSDRMVSYQVSMDHWIHKNNVFPLGGFTEVEDSKASKLPLGSHSTYVAMIYKYGILGFAGFMMILLTVMIRYFKRSRNKIEAFLLCASLLLIMVFEDFLLDPINYLMLFILLGLYSRQSSVSLKKQNNRIVVPKKGNNDFLLICTTIAGGNNENNLMRMLDSLPLQNMNMKKLKVILVYQNCPYTELELKQQFREYPFVLPMAEEDIISLSKARNIALKYANKNNLIKDQTVVGFADDDCWYYEDVLKQIQMAFTEKQMDIIAGVYSDKEDCIPLQRFIGETRKMDYEIALKYTSSITTYYKGYVIKNNGLFDERFGVGAELGAAEDVDYLIRALKNGYKGVYDPMYVIGHEVKAGNKYRYFKGNLALIAKHSGDIPQFNLILVRRILGGIRNILIKKMSIKDFAISLKIAGSMIFKK